MNMRKMLKEAQKMQDKMQRELGETFVDASVGGGILTVKMNGHKMLVSAKIDPEAMDSEDPEMLEDLIVAVVNEASRKVDESLQHKMGSLTANIPGLF